MLDIKRFYNYQYLQTANTTVATVDWQTIKIAKKLFLLPDMLIWQM